MKIPDKIFPERIMSFVEKSHKNLGLNTDFMITTLLSLFSSVIGTKIKAEVKDGWIVQANLWLAVIGKSGVKKSPAIKHILKPLQNIDKENYDQYKKDKTTYELALANGEKNLEKPRYNQLIVDDTTIEALNGVLLNNPKGVLMYKDELVTLFSDAKRYDGGGNEDKFLSIYDGDTIKYNRKANDEVVRISDVFLSLIGGIQPEILIGNASQKRIFNGFMARIMFCYPDDLHYEAIEPDNLRIGMESYIDFIKKCHSTINNYDDCVVPLSEEAKVFYYEWCNEFLSPKLNNSKTPQFEAAYLSKTENTVIKFALILEVVWAIENNVNITSISQESLKLAQKVTEYFYDNFLRVQQLLGVQEPLLSQRQSKLIFSFLEAIQNKCSKQEAVVMLLGEGYTNSEVHQTLGIAKATISDWKKKYDNGAL